MGTVALDDAEGLRRKYAALSTVQFADNVPESSRVEFLQKLAPYAPALATKQDDIGLIWDPKYDFHLELDNYTPIREKAIRYPPMLSGGSRSSWTAWSVQVALSAWVQTSTPPW